MQAQEITDLAARIDRVCADKDLTYNKLAKLLGISSTTFYQITSGRTKQLSLDVLIKFNQKLDVNIAWLATGEGQVYLNDDKIKSSLIGDGDSHFGEHVISEVTKGLEELRGVFEEELRAKNNQIANLQEMLKMVLGKHNGVPSEGRIVPFFPNQEKAQA